MRIYHNIIIYTFMLLSSAPAIGQDTDTPTARGAGKTPNIATENDSPIWKNFVELRRRYRIGDLNDREMWTELTTIGEQLGSLPQLQQASILQTQASILQKTGYPILSAVHASQALAKTNNPLDSEFNRSWQILREVSKQIPIQNLLESVAETVKLGDKNPSTFGTDWNYIVGNIHAKNKQSDKALASYSKVKVNDRFFFPAKFQQAMILLDQQKVKDSIASLRAIISQTSRELSPLKRSELSLITDDANMALGRIYYEQKEFPRAIRHYRLISRSSESFYDSLYEQSWALFMAGFPNHALGTLHSIRSPFYKETFNPEATMLASIIYYWMCRYDDSRNELADFIQFHQEPIKALADLLDRKSLTNDSAYTLFENTVTGVSSEGLGLPRPLLVSASQQDSMMHVREQYASVLAELQRLETKGVFGNRDNITTARRYLEQWSAALRQDIGRRLIIELTSMKNEFERLRDQAQFLYVELLMSQKDQLLGKELHGESKIDRLSKRENIAGWGSKTQAWASDDKMEYWQDEIGFHIYRLQPLCKTK